jgi:hypothetical protein
MHERVLRRRKARAPLVGIFVTQFIEREGECGIERRGLLNRFRRVAEQARHLGGRLEIAFGIGGESPARPVDGQVLADTGEHVLQLPPVGMMIEHVVDGDERHAGRARDCGTLRQPRAVVAAKQHAGREPHALAGSFTQQGEQLRVGFFLRICNQSKSCLS